MPADRTPAQIEASRRNGARSRGPDTDAGKARSARNGTRHGLRGGPFALLPSEDPDEFAELHAAVTSDWGPRERLRPVETARGFVRVRRQREAGI
jgi:hypothetical protein